jgi:hypothetical protein
VLPSDHYDDGSVGLLGPVRISRTSAGLSHNGALRQLPPMLFPGPAGPAGGSPSSSLGSVVDGGASYLTRSRATTNPSRRGRPFADVRHHPAASSRLSMKPCRLNPELSSATRSIPLQNHEQASPPFAIPRFGGTCCRVTGRASTRSRRQSVSRST